MLGISVCSLQFGLIWLGRTCFLLAQHELAKQVVLKLPGPGTHPMGERAKSKEQVWSKIQGEFEPND